MILQARLWQGEDLLVVRIVCFFFNLSDGIGGLTCRLRAATPGVSRSVLSPSVRAMEAPSLSHMTLGHVKRKYLEIHQQVYLSVTSLA